MWFKGFLEMNFIYCEPQADERRFDLKVSTQPACKNKVALVENVLTAKRFKPPLKENRGKYKKNR